MEPEEIDKLFRDKLAGRPALPSPDAWMRLQQQLEPKKKEKTMWVYYAAASVVVLLMAGLFYFRTGQPASGPVIATVPAAQTPAPAPASEKGATEQMQVADSGPARPQAAPEPFPVQQQPAQAVTARAIAASKPQAPRARTRTTASEAPVQLAANQPQQEISQEQPAAVLAALPASPSTQTSTAPDLSIVEVKVQRHPGQDQDPGLRDNLNRKGQLLKNIYKQARNLKNGEPVELASLGVNEGRIQEETKELKQKISNVISL